MTMDPGTETLAASEEKSNIVQLDTPALAQSLPDTGAPSLAEIITEHKPTIATAPPVKTRKPRTAKVKVATKAKAKPAKVAAKAKTPKAVKEAKVKRASGTKAQGQVLKTTMAKIKRICKGHDKINKPAEFVRLAVEKYAERSEFDEYNLTK